MVTFDEIAHECSQQDRNVLSAMPTTPLEIKLMASLREARRLNNLGVVDVREIRTWHYGADDLLRLDPDNDDPEQRYDAPHRVKHRKFVAGLSR